MLKNIKQGMFPFLIGFSALSVSASAAFYSVSGLSKLFAGASLEVIIMAGSLEFAKLVTASLLYQYWDTINKTLRTYLSIATIILVLITSMGIYGFLSAEEENRKLAQEKRTIASDSLQKFQLQVLELDNNNEIAGELGPLQYLSGLTGISMDKIINWLLLIIIFVFDPLAISLVIAANFAFTQAYPKRKYKENLYGEKIEDNFSEWDNLEDIEVKDAEEIKTQDEFMTNLDNLEKIKDWEAAERRMEIIGQNGNDGEHYSELDLNKDGKIDSNELLKAKQELKHLKNSIIGVTRSSNRVDKALKRIKLLEAEISRLEEDDLTKIY